jgi:type I restriction enzyme M protein
MAIKKSDLYASLWASCDELRGGMDASQYKDYVLFMLFIKYISDKYANSTDLAPPVIIPKGASFADMVALKGKSDIGDRINTQVIQPLIDANERLARSDFPDFNDPNKLGEGQAMVDRLSNLIGIFQKPELDFSQNRAEHDDILGDAYEYLMRHFATESGKSKGQFYTPAEVSRVIAQAIGIGPNNAKASTTAYDPTCGSGSLLLKVAAQAGKHITLEGQEMDVTTAGLARMNMILHDFPTANIQQGNTLAAPKFRDGEQLRTYDYVVANPPFSLKTWSVGLTPERDSWQRFAWGVPPTKQGDYAFLLHIIRSMRSTGKGACILPHGVLFRGNAEGSIRRKLVESGILKGIIGLPANLFYGTGIPACILVLDKENAAARKGVFMIDASKDFIKDGNKNRLREQDIHRIVDTFRKQADVPRYARMVPFGKIADPKNDFNLNLPRYIDSSAPEDLQDIEGHLRGGIPERDLDALGDYWQVMPCVRAALFEPAGRPGYTRLRQPMGDVKPAILGHAEFVEFQKKATGQFDEWRASATKHLMSLGKGSHPKLLIETIAEELLAAFRKAPLLDAYDIYQHLMDYWAETMQDDAYLIAADGWVAKPLRIVETDRKGKRRDKGWACDLIPKPLIVARYFANVQAALHATQAELDTTVSTLSVLEEEHGGEEGALGSLEKIARGEVDARLKEIEGDNDSRDEADVLRSWLKLSDREAVLKRAVKELDATLDQLAYEKYAKLTEAEIKTLVVDDKWTARLAAAVQGELDRVSQTLTSRIRELAERYATPLPVLVDEVEKLAARVDKYLKAMGTSTQTAMQQLLTGRTRLPGFNSEWEVKRLGDYVTFLRNGVNSRAELTQDGPVKYLHYGDVHAWARVLMTPDTLPSLPAEKAATLDRLRDGDLVFADASEDLIGVSKSVEMIGVGTTPVVAGLHTIAARFDKNVLADGFKAYLQFCPVFAEHLRRLAAGTKVYATSRAHIASVEMHLPGVDEQTAIAAVFHDMEAELTALEARLEKTRLLKQAMMQELLPGRA